MLRLVGVELVHQHVYAQLLRTAFTLKDPKKALMTDRTVSLCFWNLHLYVKALRKHVGEIVDRIEYFVFKNASLN